MLDNGNAFDVMYLDFQKVFDTVPHKTCEQNSHSWNKRKNRHIDKKLAE